MNDSSQVSYADAVAVTVSIASAEQSDATKPANNTNAQPLECSVDLQSILQTSASYVIAFLLQLIAGNNNAIAEDTNNAVFTSDADTDKWPVFTRRLLPHCETHVSGGGRLSVSIELVDQQQMRQLNHQYRQRDKATNVLSFPALQECHLDEQSNEAADMELLQQIMLLSGENTAEQNNLGAAAAELPVGDIVLCAPVVDAEARAQQKSADAHWAHMVVHGVLHLFGFDHDNDAAANCMEAIETRVLNDLGYPAPYV